MMASAKFSVPTYYGGVEPELEVEPEFGEPDIPILACAGGGLRVILGSHDYLDTKAPDLLIERRPNGWAIFLHPGGDGDPSGGVYFIDDGRSFLVPERDCGFPLSIATLPCDAEVSEVDHKD